MAVLRYAARSPPCSPSNCLTVAGSLGLRQEDCCHVLPIGAWPGKLSGMATRSAGIGFEPGILPLATIRRYWPGHAIWGYRFPDARHPAAKNAPDPGVGSWYGHRAVRDIGLAATVPCQSGPSAVENRQPGPECSASALLGKNPIRLGLVLPAASYPGGCVACRRPITPNAVDPAGCRWLPGKSPARRP